MWNKRFLDQMTEFIFVEQEPKPADIIFVPGSGFPQIAEKAASLYREGFSELVLPSGKYSILRGRFGGVQAKEEEYRGTYEDRVGIFKGCPCKAWCEGMPHMEGGKGYLHI